MWDLDSHPVQRMSVPVAQDRRRARAAERRGCALATAFPSNSAPPDAGARRPGDGARVQRPGAARGAVPVRRRGPGVPLARRPRPSPDELPRRGARGPAADLGRDADVAHQGRARRARRRGRGRRPAPRAPVHRRRDAAGGARDAALAVGARRRELGRSARRGDRHRGRGRPLRGALRGGDRAARPGDQRLAGTRGAGGRRGRTRCRARTSA